MLGSLAVSTLIPYGIVAWAEFRSKLHYIAASLGGFVVQYAFGLIRVYIILTLLTSATTDLGGYTRETAITYTWATQALAAALGTFTPSRMAAQIRSGDFSIDLLRPLNLQFMTLAQDCGLSAYHFLTRGALVYIAGMATFRLPLTLSLATLTTGLVAVILASALSSMLRIVVAAFGFWVTETRALFQFYIAIATFMGGFMIPIHLFPDWLQTISYCLPFACIFQLPIDVATGFTAALTAWQVLAMQAAWLMPAVAIGHFMLRAGTRKVEVQGG